MSDTQQRIDGLVKSSEILLFMKGSASFPMCGFSGRAIQILKACGVDPKSVVTVNVLEDDEIRQGIKEYSNWPTIPQLYVKGEFIGGADIVTEMFQAGELQTHLADKGIAAARMTLAAPASTRSATVPLIAVVVAGCIIAAITNGIRNSFGLFTLPVTADLGISRETWAMAMAIQNLAWGIAQPFAGGFADRYGSGRVIAAGLAVYAVGLVLTSVSPTGSLLYLTAGIVAGAGFATCGFSIIMAAFGRAVPPEKRSFIFGIATAASSFGQFVFAPISQGFISAFGWQSAFVSLAAIVVLAIPLTIALRGRSESVPGEADLPFMEAISRAWGF
eukprot:gene40842-54054_t